MALSLASTVSPVFTSECEELAARPKTLSALAIIDKAIQTYLSFSEKAA